MVCGLDFEPKIMETSLVICIVYYAKGSLVHTVAVSMDGSLLQITELSVIFNPLVHLIVLHAGCY